jgi:hypothetical protein
MRNKLRSAIIAGGIIALLSLIPLLSYGFFFWAIAGGVLASYLYIKKSPTPVQIAEGLLLGVMSGIVGNLLYLFIAIPLIYFDLSNANQGLKNRPTKSCRIGLWNINSSNSMSGSVAVTINIPS